MSAKIGSNENPLRVAVIGAGPSGFYACEELLKQQDIAVTCDLFDRLPTPYGLVRGGVAPDHQKIKSVIKLFDRTAAREGFRFFGNVAYGAPGEAGALSLEDFLAHYHTVLFATGAEKDRRMGIPGEDLAGSHPATEFVAWYNGHPDYRDLEFDLSAEAAVVVGNGNVAMDVVRILARPIDELAETDIAEHALEALRNSKLKRLYLVGRRGPAMAAFTNPEIRELCNMEGCDLVLQREEVEPDALSQEFLDNAKDPVHKRNMATLLEHLEKPPGNAPKQLHARFFLSPVEITGSGRMEAVRLERNALVKDDKGNLRAKGTGEQEDIPAQLIFRSIGYLGTALPGLPFDDWSGTLPNAEGRIVDPDKDNAPIPRLYTAGWIKRGPSGVIGTNKPCAISTVKAMLADLPALNADPADARPEAVDALLAERGIQAVSFADWQRLDALEVANGEKVGKPREKFTRVADMLSALG